MMNEYIKQMREAVGAAARTDGVERYASMLALASIAESLAVIAAAVAPPDNKRDINDLKPGERVSLSNLEW
jgi:hypothetical protein